MVSINPLTDRRPSFDSEYSFDLDPGLLRRLETGTVRAIAER